MSANDTQISGEHYKKKKIQPWDFIMANGIGYFEGNAIKYLCRWREKNGVEDLKKARHYIDKLIESQEIEQTQDEPIIWQLGAGGDAWAAVPNEAMIHVVLKIGQQLWCRKDEFQPADILLWSYNQASTTK